MLAFGPRRCLRADARLRGLQALTGGVEGWLALPDLPAGVTLTCARGTHRVQMTENILGALFHLTKPYAAITVDQRERRWTRRVSETLAGKTLGILGLGAIGRELAKKAAALEMRVIGTRPARPRCLTWSACMGRPTPILCWPPPTSCCCCCP
jgi:phosphoglycerate dehydrogenase-like enzyme